MGTKRTLEYDGLSIEICRGEDGKLVVWIDGPEDDLDRDELGSPDIRVRLNAEVIYSNGIAGGPTVGR
jgi:hypothetical protein